MAGLSIAALTAVVALLAGDFDDTSWRVILSSLGFAVCSAVGSAGASQRFRPSGALRTIGTATAALAGLTFVLLLAGLWTEDWGSEPIWRCFGSAAVLAIAGAHAGVVLGALRRSDTGAVRAIVIASIVLAVVDTAAGLLPITGLTEEVGDAGARLLGVALVLLILTSLLPPIMRRLGPRGGARGDGLERFAEEVATVAERIEQLARGPALRTPEIRREAERLRALARSFER